MQLRLPWDILKSAPARPPRRVVVEGREFPVQVTRRRGARRYILRVAADGVLKLTVPWSASIGAGVRFAEGQSAWIAREWRRQAARHEAWTTGARCWYRGEPTPLVVLDDRIRLADQNIARSARDGDLRGPVERHLRALATRELPPRCLAFARDLGFRVTKVSVRNQRSRWGACSPSGMITLNWRLVQMPPAVADYVMLHELAHITHPNHSRRFWREVDRLCPPWRDAERWLRATGKELL